MMTGEQLMNVFTGQVATAEQTKDMLSFRQVGIQAYKQYISTRILQSPSHTNTTLRRNKLLTMGSIKAKRKRATPKEQHDRHVIKGGYCGATNTRHHLILAKSSTLCYQEHYVMKMECLTSQVRATGLRNYKTLSNGTRVKQELSNIPSQAVITDAMFMLNTMPLQRINTIAEYSKLLFHQYVLKHLKTAISRIHLVFDSPSRNCFNQRNLNKLNSTIRMQLKSMNIATLM